MYPFDLRVKLASMNAVRGRRSFGETKEDPLLAMGFDFDQVRYCCLQRCTLIAFLIAQVRAALEAAGSDVERAGDTLLATAAAGTFGACVSV